MFNGGSPSKQGDSQALRHRPDMSDLPYKLKGPTSAIPCTRTGMLSAAAYAILPTWATMVLVVSMIFGGCCSNVFALEAIIKEEPNAGPLITFVQFLLTALLTYPSFVSPSAGLRALYLAPRAIPLRSWFVYTAFFVSVNLLNNWAFAYKISVPLHIIVRSAGPVASMLVGYFFNARRYSGAQILAVTLLTAGVGIAALADAAQKGQPFSLSRIAGSTGARSGNTPPFAATSIGFLILVLAMILSAFQGTYADHLYEIHGRAHWREALFYSHILSLPLFLPAMTQIRSRWNSILQSTSLASLTKDVPGILASWIATSSLAGRVPAQLAFLAVNVLTQYLCIRGVHLLSARSSSLTVIIVLNVRKLVSLLLSICLFGNRLAAGVLVGAGLVFVGGGLYGIEGARLRKIGSVKKSR